MSNTFEPSFCINEECGYVADEYNKKVCPDCGGWLWTECGFCYGAGGGEVRDPVGYGPFDSPAYETRWDECPECEGEGLVTVAFG